MGSLFLGLLLSNIVAFVVVVASMPFHFKTSNVITISMGFWLSMYSLIHIVNCIVWRHDADIRAPVWGDITASFTIGFHYGIPLAHLMLARQLANMTSLVQDSVMYSIQRQRREVLFTKLFAIGIPILGVLLHISVMQRRFAIMEGFGPIPVSRDDGWGFTVTSALPILFAVGATYFTIQLLYNLFVRRRELMSMCYDSSSMGRNHFWRLTSLATVMFTSCLVRLVADVVFRAANTRLDGTRMTRNMSEIEQVTADSMLQLHKSSMILQWSGNVVCSVVFFACFVTSSEVKRFYRDTGRKALGLKPIDSVCTNASSEDSYQLRSKASALIKSPEQEDFFDVLLEGPGGATVPSLGKHQKTTQEDPALSFEKFCSKGDWPAEVVPASK